MNVLQVNVRLNEGGAAGIALDLHRRLSEIEGVSSEYLYGYGRKGLANPSESMLGARKMTSAVAALTNLVSHNVVGLNILGPTLHRNSLVDRYVEWADVIHLHVLHSYYLRESDFINYLIGKSKKIVWTQHDHWILTGRCAFLDECQGWRSGCGSCNGMRNYPKSIFDFSSREFVNKRRMIEDFVSYGGVFVSPSRHLAKDIFEGLGGAKVEIVPNGLDLATENYLLSYNNKVDHRRGNGTLKVLVIAHDLEYQGKTNRDYVNRIIEVPGVELHTVGKNSPFHGVSVFNHGYIGKRSDLYDIVSSCDVMFFSSVVDNFPLVIGESLCLGVPVLATPSNAAEEVLSIMGGNCQDIDDVCESLSLGLDYILSGFGCLDRIALSEKAISSFMGSLMVERYLKIYEGV
jgi:putative colanic acid biosynthesis glycosyltransferase